MLQCATCHTLESCPAKACASSCPFMLQWATCHTCESCPAKARVLANQAFDRGVVPQQDIWCTTTGHGHVTRQLHSRMCLRCSSDSGDSGRLLSKKALRSIRKTRDGWGALDHLTTAKALGDLSCKKSSRGLSILSCAACCGAETGPPPSRRPAGPTQAPQTSTLDDARQTSTLHDAKQMTPMAAAAPSPDCSIQPGSTGDASPHHASCKPPSPQPPISSHVP